MKFTFENKKEENKKSIVNNVYSFITGVLAAPGFFLHELCHFLMVLSLRGEVIEVNFTIYDYKRLSYSASVDFIIFEKVYKNIMCALAPFIGFFIILSVLLINFELSVEYITLLLLCIPSLHILIPSIPDFEFSLLVIAVENGYITENFEYRVVPLEQAKPFNIPQFLKVIKYYFSL